MKTHDFYGKTKEDAIEKAIEELKIKEEDAYFFDTEETGGLFKGKKTKVKVLTKEEIISFSKEFISNITKLMNIEVNIEAKQRDRYIKIHLYSDNNPILIGKAGKTIEALQILIKSSIQNQTGFKVNVILDVEDYKEKQQKNLEYNSKKIAIEVKRTGVEAKLDPMNSFERRLIHNVCNEVGGVYTESVGEEPNRYVIIKKKES